jgi:hypothetical protein
MRQVQESDSIHVEVPSITSRHFHQNIALTVGRIFGSDMRLIEVRFLALLVWLSHASFIVAFSASLPVSRHGRQPTIWALSVSTTPVAETPTPEATNIEEVDLAVPTVLPSDCGMDYIPLANMLATGQLVEADQVRLSSGSYRRIRSINRKGR